MTPKAVRQRTQRSRDDAEAGSAPGGRAMTPKQSVIAPRRSRDDAEAVRQRTRRSRDDAEAVRHRIPEVAR